MVAFSLNASIKSLRISMRDKRLERIQRICLALPEATEQEAWGAPTFRVRKKMFAMHAKSVNRVEASRDALWCNAPEGMQEILASNEPEKYFVPPYMGVKGWIGILLDNVDDEELEALVTQSYCMVAPKKLQALVSE